MALPRAFRRAIARSGSATCSGQSRYAPWIGQGTLVASKAATMLPPETAPTVLT
jgi:hypothetical protein